ncbi:MAG: hypothetical protein JSR39_01145 [Verrucomicrobia bacterium]|nr:hypothetical protein [Verrucomicrobiota bacterium]
MKSLVLKACVVLPLILAGCDSKTEEEEVDYDRMVNNEEVTEWTSGPELDGKLIAGDLFPEPQEVMVQESVDGSSKLDGSTIR